MTQLDNAHKLPPAPTTLELARDGDIDPTMDYPPPHRPMQTARQLIADIWTRGDMRTLAHWNGTFWQWTGTHYAPVDDLEVRGPIYERLEQVTYSGKDGPRPWDPTTARVSGIMEPLAIQVHLTTDTTPMWRHNPTRPTDGLIPMANGLLDYAAGTLTPHSPDFFTTWALPFDYQPRATCPQWKTFIADTFAHDPAGGRCLQEWAGYLISGRTDLQTALMVLGPPASGKGVISHIMKSLMGLSNAASPTMGDFDTPHGLESVIGKPLTVVEDAREAGRYANGKALSNFLSLIANDYMSINPKYRPVWYGHLNTRLMLFSNELPRFSDASGAILRRFKIIRLARSHQDAPDTGLTSRLLKELSGIFLWALEGLERLEKQGHLTTPATHSEQIALMSDTAQPVKAFMEDYADYFHVTNDQNDHVEISVLLKEWKAFCTETERKPGNRETFTTRLSATYPGVKCTSIYTRPDRRGMKRVARGIKQIAPLPAPQHW